MKELIVNAPALTIESNLSELKEQALQLVKNYTMEVTVENVPEAKSLATELNKMNAEVKKVVKLHTDQLTAPINAFKEEAKQILVIIEEARQELLKGIDVFNEARRLEHKLKLDDYMAFLVEENKIREEFQDLHTSHLTTLTGLTKAGELNKASKEKVKQAVTEMLNKQTQSDLAKAQQDKEDEERIKKEVEQRLESEREKEREKERQRLERQLKAELKAQRQPVPVEDKRPPEHRGGDTDPYYPPAPSEPAPTDGKVEYEVTFTFRLKAKPGIPAEALLNKVTPMFIAQGQTPHSARSIEINYEKI